MSGIIRSIGKPSVENQQPEILSSSIVLAEDAHSVDSIEESLELAKGRLDSSNPVTRNLARLAIRYRTWQLTAFQDEL